MLKQFLRQQRTIKLVRLAEANLSTAQRNVRLNGQTKYTRASIAGMQRTIIKLQTKLEGLNYGRKPE